MTGETNAESSQATPRGAVVAMRYAIEARLGKGGIGAVYLASDIYAGGRAVALKILREDRLDAEREKGLRTEYTTLSRLRHPHVEAVFDYGRDPSHGVYIAKEYLSGTDLMRATEGLSIEECLQLSMQLFRALAFLHSRKLIHNDIKPDNVIVVRDPSAELQRRAVLIDFGIASQYSHEDTEQTPTGLVGTLGYMAPERVKGAKPDARTDLYASGMVLFRLLTRTFPFNPKAQAPELLAFHLYQPPPRPSEVRPGIPPAVDELVLRLLSKDRDQRFGSAHDVMQAIARILHRSEPLETEATQEGYVRSVPLVGREEEMKALHAFLERALKGERAKGEPAMVLLAGAAGIGKSRLQGEVLVRARVAGATVLTGSGRRHGGGLGPLRVPLRRLMTEEEAQKALEFMDQTEHEERADRQEIVRTLGDLLLERGKDVVLAIEDLHNTDDLTLDLLTYVGRLLRDNPSARLAGILAMRDQRTPRLQAFREVLEREHLARILTLHPLTEEQAMRFATEALSMRPDPKLARALWQRTGGEPGAMQEALKFLMGSGLLSERTWREPGAWDLCIDALPEGVQPILSGRIAMLSPEARLALRVLSVVNRSVPPSVVAAGANLEPALAANVLGDLAKREISLTRVVDGEMHHVLAHDRMAQAILEATPEEEVREIHDRLARAMESLPPKRREDWLLDLAYHAIRSGKAARAATHALEAGRRLEALYAWDQAIELYESLVEVPVLEGGTYVKTHLRLARIHEQTGDSRNAIRCLGIADRQARILGLDAERAAALHQAAEIADRRGQRWKAEVRAIKAMAIYEQLDDRAGVANLKLLMARFVYQDRDYKRALTLVSEARRLFEEMGDVPGLGQALNLRGMVLWRQKKLDEAAHYFRQAFRIAGIVSALANWGIAQIEMGDFKEANRLLKDAMGLAKREGRLRDRAVVELHLGYLRIEEGHLSEARALFDSALETFEGLQELGTAAVTTAAIARVAQGTGDLAASAQHVSRSFELLKDQPPGSALAMALRQMACLSMLRGDLENARKAAVRAARTDAQGAEPKAQGFDALCLAEIAMELGHREEYLREIFDARSAFGSVHSPSGLLATDILLARGERFWGSPREACKQIEECVRTADSRDMTLLGVTAELEMGMLLASLEEDEKALARLDRCLAYARAEGARPIEAHALLTVGAIHLKAGKAQAAMEELERCGPAARDPSNMFLVHRALCLRARLLLQMGRHSEALAQAASVAQGVRHLGMTRLVIEADALIADIAAAAGQAGIAEAARRRVAEAAAAAGFRCFG